MRVPLRTRSVHDFRSISRTWRNVDRGIPVTKPRAASSRPGRDPLGEGPEVHRLLDESLEAEGPEPLRDLRCPERRHHDHRDGGHLATHPGQELEPVHLGHLQVRHDEVDRLAPKDGGGLVAVRGRPDDEAPLEREQALREALGEERLVVHDQHGALGVRGHHPVAVQAYCQRRVAGRDAAESA